MLRDKQQGGATHSPVRTCGRSFAPNRGWCPRACRISLWHPKQQADLPQPLKIEWTAFRQCVWVFDQIGSAEWAVPQ